MSHSLSFDRPARTACYREALQGINPRVAMDHRLPRALQPFLTWLTAQPAAAEAGRSRSPLIFVVYACGQVVSGVALGLVGWPNSMALLLVGMALTTAGLGLFQVVIFHHCSHGTVFRTRWMNTFIGRLISVVILFNHFDDYRHEHMLHHNNNKLLTEEDEFAKFVFDTCQLRPGQPLGVLRQRVLWNLVSPHFHLRFTLRRLRAAWLSKRPQDTVAGVAVWLMAGSLAVVTGYGWAFVFAWVVPTTVLLQIATVGRILCEHSFPPAEVIAARGRNFSSRATGGVFAGSMPPAESGSTLQGFLAWLAWWIVMLAVQLPVRVIVLVGDAPCHDFHHRKPASRRWTAYIHARREDQTAGSTRLDSDYQETWGLFNAIDATLASLSQLPPGTML